MSFRSVFAQVLRRTPGQCLTRAHRRNRQPLLELLEERLAPSATQWAFDFGTKTSPVAPGYIGVSNQNYSSSSGYGWAGTSNQFAFDDGGTNPLTRDGMRIYQSGTFLANVSNGNYQVTATLGDAKSV